MSRRQLWFQVSKAQKGAFVSPNTIKTRRLALSCSWHNLKRPISSLTNTLSRSHLLGIQFPAVHPSLLSRLDGCTIMSIRRPHSTKGTDKKPPLANGNGSGESEHRDHDHSHDSHSHSFFGHSHSHDEHSHGAEIMAALEKSGVWMIGGL